MVRDIEIKGGANEFEAAVIAVVIDRISQVEKATRERRGSSQHGLSAWVRALAPVRPGETRDRVWPD